MASIALAFWIFLFGSGKYKSWGVMQRYILQTSPNSKRFRDSRSPSPPKGFVENAKHLVKMQLLRLDSSADHDMDHVPLKSSAAQTHARRLSTRYSAGVNPNLNTDAVAAAAAMSSGAPRNDDNRGSKEDYDPTARYSMVSDGYNNFYFTEQGTPRTQALQPLAPINDNEDDSEVQVNELIQLIDLRIDERMWSLERTLARYYLDGFRLRNYSKNYDPYQTEQPLQDEKEQQQQQQQQEQRATKDEESGASHSGPGGSGYGAGRTDSASTAVELLQDNNNASHPGPSSPPLYPPRPKVTTPFKFAGDPSGANTGPGGYGMAPPALASRPHLQGSTSQGSTSQGMANEILASSNVPDNGFPPRKNIRGTIRRAVERLQNEWPQDLSAPPLPTQPYVPRTQYQGRPNQGGNGGNQSYSLPPPPPQY
ncbi:hypothetical protein BGX31_004865 [Mortierella sp. GBA43]|nr:hypothetical protein BGX31_004865 [Mortierella sp. GBA43]